MDFFSRSRILRNVLTPVQAFAAGLAGTMLLAMPAVRISQQSPPEAGILLAALVAFPLTIAAGVDAACHILPDPLLLLAATIALARYAFAGAGAGLHAIVAAAAACFLARAIHRFTSLGMGDVKLLAVLALWLGSLRLALVGATLGIAAAGIYSLALMAARRATMTTSIALGPWLWTGSALVWLVSLAA